MNVRINHLVVWILIVVYFLIGWGWYAVFGEIWLNQHAKAATDIEHTHTFGPYVLAFVASIVINYVLAVLIARTNPESPWCGVKVALALWVVLFLEYATISVFSAFETNPWPLICIDMGRPLLGMAISGLVLGKWRRT
jgi:Protein of unknown function (DUF1761)